MRALVVSSVVMVCLSQTLLGYDIGIMSGAMIFVRKYFDLSDQQTELAVGVTNLVATIGAFLAGSFADSLGRRLVIFISNAAFLLGAAFTAGAWNFESFVVGRVVMGLGVGGGLTIPAV
uniref:Hexose transporter 1 n=1 Tax=Chromera velia CCMP2878 TaxID=1169474 RepID=A0A0G4HP05_9ALVE|eukprot:Cvel_7705.t1-p1 / transcript=Cvel_7705.t1 / gene=Cvel_7705 / organism=Chromera_velia_CCMP2878 / gene_product=Putative polyol transporter 1, putative / transcript_product=Putative polyol transporter 1, putative / location=Cvel_scaffold409:45290-46073(-) / protein_length=118 / sequence_SO=supercontig / SO=protein_coding / is_pseudo=false